MCQNRSHWIRAKTRCQIACVHALPYIPHTPNACTLSLSHAHCTRVNMLATRTSVIILPRNHSDSVLLQILLFIVKFSNTSIGPILIFFKPNTPNARTLKKSFARTLHTCEHARNSHFSKNFTSESQRYYCCV